MNKGNKAIRHEGNKRYRGIAFKLLKIFAIPQYIYTSIPLKKRIAFSLIEIMISLITISIIVAAFTPVISKKMKSTDITVLQNNSGLITDKCEDIDPSGYCKLCTKTYCIQCDRTCSSGQYLDNTVCSCKHCSDKFSNCKECDSDKCIKCNQTHYLDGKTCTVCPSGKFCNGTDKIYDSCADAAGNGNYCDNSGNIKSCASKYGDYCQYCTKDNCTYCTGYHWNTANNCKNTCIVGCVRCSNSSTCDTCQNDWVYNASTGQCDWWCGSHIANCRICQGSKTNSSNAGLSCQQCSNGFYMLNGACASCPSNCAYCDSSGKCKTCYGGYYVTSSGTCSACSSKFGSNCVVCTASNCLSCAPLYTLDENTAKNPACKESDNQFRCNDHNFMRIGSLCVTKKNMGDSTSLAIPSSAGITTVSAGSGGICYAASQKCCWNGTTSPVEAGCDDNPYGYSGCNRTVCSWDAGNAICNAFNYAGKKWRLPTSDELTNILAMAGPTLGTNGLKLCDCTGLDLAVRPFCQYYDGACKGAYSNNCYPGMVWSSTGENGWYSYSVMLNRYLQHDNINIHSMALSVRCVTEMEDE